jgi:23S rRNA (cytidine1920-2'-O)/16S rRNA (cytidine1409-2'-O)-methyltransferase
MSNSVSIAGKLVNKPGAQIDLAKYSPQCKKHQDLIQVKYNKSPYVSRGAEKLKTAYEKFALDFNGALVLDLGASTGGFTDFALQQGAKKVIAIDVGKGQLDFRLRKDPRVINIEEQNIKHLQYAQLSLGEPIDFILADLSFISLTKIIEPLIKLIESNRLETGVNKPIKMILLIKPQFEAGKEVVDKCKGVIKDSKIRERVLEDTLQAISSCGPSLENCCESAIKGAKGNIEYLAYFLY